MMANIMAIFFIVGTLEDANEYEKDIMIMQIILICMGCLGVSCTPTISGFIHDIKKRLFMMFTIKVFK